jgi:hypothetical protein
VADTGSPWFIPFAEPTDLVRDWPDLSEDVADAVAAGLTAAGTEGIGPNVVSATKVDFFTTTSTSKTDVTGLTATITPSSNTSKVLAIVSIVISNSGANDYSAILVRDSTEIGSGTGGSTRNGFGANRGNSAVAHGYSMAFLDSPNTDLPVTYKVQVHGDGGTTTVNRAGSLTVNGSSSTLTLIEVSA